MTVQLPGPAACARAAAVRVAAVRVVAVALCLLGIGLPAGSAARAEGAKEHPLGLTVVVENDTDRLFARTEVVYEIKVRNDGPDDFPAAVVSQLLPPGFTYLESGSEVRSRRTNQVQWVAPVPAGGEILIVMTGRVGERSDVPEVQGEARLTTTACVAPARGQRLAGCASDSDLVGPPLTGSGEIDNILISAVLIGAVFCGGGGYLWYRLAAANKRP